MARFLACIGLGAWILLLGPFPITTFLGVCVGCVSYPFYIKHLKRRLPSGWVVPIYGIGLAVMVILPITVLILLITPQAVAGLSTLEHLRDINWWNNLPKPEWLLAIEEFLNNIPELRDMLDQFTSSLVGMAGSAARTVLSSSLGFAGGVFQFALDIIIFVMVAVLCVENANPLRKMTLCISGFSRPMHRRFSKTIRGAISAVLTGVILVAIIQGVLCGAAFAVAKVPQSAFWGLIATFVAPIPFVGTSLVWIPICIWLWVNGSSFAAVGVALWGLIVVTGVDNVLRPFFLKTGIDASISTLLLSIICGLSALGPVGIFAGPILVALGIQAYHESLVFIQQQKHV